ncbi:MAG: insulinase family protein [Planctomycetota bacterium]
MRAHLLIILALALVAALPASLVFAQDGNDDGKPFSIPVQERMLENGLKILVVENPASESISCRLFFRVGSANEEPGLTGLAHYLEHLQFKGTDKVGVKNLEEDRRIRKELDEVYDRIRALERYAQLSDDETAEMTKLKDRMAALIEEQKGVVYTREIWDIYQAAGGTGMNASTSRDWTQYQVTLPANKLELFMWIEADRLRNSTFREFFAERKVVREERRLAENRPDSAFNEAFQQMTFGSSGYSWPTLGWHAELENATRADAMRFYNTWYQPDNAVMILVGNVKADDAYAMAHRYFGHIPKGTLPRKTLPVIQPRAVGERTMRGTTTSAPSVQLVYYRQRGCCQDEAVYMVISGLLTGGSGRLEKKLVRELEIATRVDANTLPARYVNTYDIDATAKDNVSSAQLLAAIDAELQKLCDEPVGEDELRRAKNALKSRLVGFLRNDEFLGIVLGMFEVVDSWHAVNRLFERAETVTPEDIQRIAQETFRKENRCVGLLDKAGDDAPAPLPAIAGERWPDSGRQPAVWRPAAGTALVAPAVSHTDLAYAERTFTVPNADDYRITLPNGIVVYLKEDHRFPTISVNAHIKGGGLWEPREMIGLASATGDLMKSGGTATLDENALDEALAGMAATLSSGFDSTRGNVGMTCFSTDTEAALKLMRDVLVQPQFRDEALARWKARALQALEHRNDTPGQMWRREWALRAFGEMHPVSRLSTEGSINRINREALQDFHRTHVRPGTVIFSVSGHFDRAAMAKKLADTFGSWAGADSELLSVPVTEAPVGKRAVHFLEKQSSQGYVAIGHPSFMRPNDDYYTMQLLNRVLSARLFESVRRDEGLAYTAGSGFTANEDHPGQFMAIFQSKSESVARALQLTLQQIDRIRKEAIPAEELETARKNLIDSFPQLFGDAGRTMELFALTEMAGRPKDSLTTWREKMQAITAEQLLVAAETHIHPEQFTILIVGQREPIEAAASEHYMTLDAFGPVTYTVIDKPRTTGKDLTPTEMVVKSLEALKSGDVDAYVECFIDAVKAQFNDDIKKQIQAQLAMITSISWETTGEDIKDDRATVTVVMTFEVAGQKQSQERTMPLMKENGKWKIMSPR